MAFNLQGFQFYRGTTTAQAQGEGITSVTHTYKSTDTVAVILTPGYFHVNIDGTTDKVFPGDLLSVVASDDVALVQILTLNPVTFGSNIYAVGPALSVGAPVAAADNNGAIIVGNIFHQEIASDTRPGILSSSTQNIGGAKTFFANTTIVPAVGDFGGTPVTNGLQIRSISAISGVEMFNTGVSNVQHVGFGSIALGANYASMGFKANGFIGATPELALINNSNIGLTVQNTGIVELPEGILLPAPGGAQTLMNYFETNTFTTTFTNAGATTTNVIISVFKLNSMVMLLWQQAQGSGVNAAVPGTTYLSDTLLPVSFRPAGNQAAAIRITQAGVSTVNPGYIRVNTSGTIELFIDYTLTTAYTASVAVLFGPVSLSYFAS